MENKKGDSENEKINKYYILAKLNETNTFNIDKLTYDDKDLKLNSELNDFFKKYHNEIYKFLNKNEDNKKAGNEIYNNVSKFYDNYKLYDKIDNLSSFSIKSGILILNFKNGNKEYINLVFSEEEGKKNIEELKRTGNITLKELGKLKEDTFFLNHDILLGGTTFVLFGAIDAGKNFFIDNVFIKSKNGKSKKINLLKSNINYGTKEELKKNLFRILKEQGYEFNSKTLGFEQINKKLLNNIKNGLKNIKYSDYKKIQEKEGGKILTETEFKNNLKVISKEIGKTNLKTDLKSILKEVKISEKVFSLLFIPVFFSEFHNDNSDITKLGGGFIDWGLFESGVMLGEKIPINNFPIIKQIIALGIGMGFSMLGNYGIKKIDKEIWKTFPERINFTEKIGGGEFTDNFIYGVTGGLITDLGDKLPFNIPLITHTKVDFDTNIISYMSQGKITRDIDFWNKRVDEYGYRLKKDILPIIKKYFNDIEIQKKQNNITGGGFIETITEKKKEEAIKKLNKSLSSLLGLENNENLEIKKGLYDGILGLINSKNFTADKDNIYFLIDNYLNEFKINKDSLEKVKDKNGILLADINGILSRNITPININNLKVESLKKISNELIEKLIKEINGYKYLEKRHKNTKFWNDRKNIYLINKLQTLISKIGKEGELSNNCKKEIFEYLKTKFNSGNFNINKDELKGIINNNIEESNYIKGLTDKKIQDFCVKIFNRLNSHKDMIDADINLGEIDSKLYGKFLKDKNLFKRKNQYIGDHNMLMQKSEDRIMFEKLIESDIFLNLLNNMIEFKKNNEFLENIKHGYGMKYHG